MPFDLIFNELSVLTPAQDHHTGCRWMDEFVATLRQCRKAGVSGGLRVPKQFHHMLLANDYPIGRWIGDRSIDRNQRDFVRVVITKAPFLEDLLVDSVQNSYELAEFTCEGRTSQGLALAFLLDSLSVSLSSDTPWKRSAIPIGIFALDESATELDDVAMVRNASTPTHVTEHSSWISKRRITDIVSGRDLWDRRAYLFPSLDFCLEVETQIENLAANDPCFIFAVKAFADLQDFCVNWTSSAFDQRSLGNCSRESQPTMQQYGESRAFTAPEGNKVVFEWHLKRFDFRTYFTPLGSTKRMLIGYVGRHLRTVKYN